MGTPYEELKGLADAIREKTGITEKLTLDQMVDEINEIFTKQEEIIEKIINDTIKRIDISYGVQKIHNYTFYECKSLTNITIPESVTSIGGYAFYNCTSLTNITIPESVTSIGEYTFRGCASLSSITLLNNVSVVTMSNSYVLLGTKIASNKGYIYVPSNLVDEYKTATNWSAHADRIVAITE